jgi:protein PhnA
VAQVDAHELAHRGGLVQRLLHRRIAQVRDSTGKVLADGDAVVLIKALKVKGSSITLKMGTKVKSIRLTGGDHEVDCKMDAGSFMLKACYLRKA